MKKKYIVLLILQVLLLSNLQLYSQGKRKSQTKDTENKPYLFWGGALWAGIGTYTYVDVNVIFGSQLTDRLSLGIMGKYQYYKDKRAIGGDFETNVYGGSLFSQYAVIKDFRNLFQVKGHGGIMAHAEYEFLNTKYNYLYFNVSDSEKGRYWLNNVLIGGGYFQHMGKRSKTFIVLLWNATKTVDNPYTYPQLRIGFTSSF
ncbi:MAG: hypothetical protein KAR57_03565 [Bacteroidales bacterium]|nr:hypothetical protein [Bacteroidales bacterium]